MHITYETVIRMAAEKVNITTREVAERARVHPSTVRRWVLDGLLKPSMKTPGGQFRFDAEDVERLLREAAA